MRFLLRSLFESNSACLQGCSTAIAHEAFSLKKCFDDKNLFGYFEPILDIQAAIVWLFH